MIPDFPTTRSEAYLAKICGEDAEIPEPQTRTDLFLAAIAGADVTTPEPQTRSEIFLASILDQSVELPAPQSRMEFFLAKIAGLDVETPEPQTRLERYLSEWAQGGGEEYETVTGAIATFTTLRAAPLKELLVNIDPVQSGSGDPSPDNVRPISGTSEIRIEHSGLNMQTGLSIGGEWYISGKYLQPFLFHTATSTFKKERGIWLVAGQTYRIYFEIPSDKARGIGIYGARLGSSSQINIIGVASRSVIDVTYTPSVSDYYGFWVYASSNWDGIDSTNSFFQIQAGGGAFDHYEAPNYSKQTITIPATPGTVYGGTLDVLTGTLTARPYYASYNGETLVGPWVSSMDTYAAGAAPTTGAQVVDLGGTPTVVQLDPETLSTLLGANNIWADTGDVTVTYQSN